MLFFFQAEDGIRDIGVTGVQTCALPISPIGAAALGSEAAEALTEGEGEALSRGRCAKAADANAAAIIAVITSTRSEERRVGKECRSRWSPYHYKKKKR